MNTQGQTFAVIAKPGEFWMGRSSGETGHGEGDETRHRVRIDRTYAIATREVTWAQFEQFLQGHRQFTSWGPDKDGPVNNVTWYGAAAYCNWLSKQEGLPESEWCYPKSVGRGVVRDLPVNRMPEGYLQRKGYRLPTEAEWEYACRAGAETAWSHGSSEQLLEQYAWYGRDSGNRMRLGGEKKPNDFGLFDMHGNAWEWCHSRFEEHPKVGVWVDEEDKKDVEEGLNSERRVLRGGAFDSDAFDLRSADGGRNAPFFHNGWRGIRVARTFCP